MLELIAQGANPDSRWRRTLPADTDIELGRLTRPWSVGWDPNISRRHFLLRLDGKTLLVRKFDEAANPIFHQGTEKNEFEIEPGDHFVVGKTTFTLRNDRAFATQDVPHPISQRTFSSDFIRQVRYRDADRRIEVLNRLPQLISAASDEDDLLIRFVNLLLTGISTATAVGLVREDEQGQSEIITWDRRDVALGDFEPSDRLIHQAIETRETVLHVWGMGGSGGPYTQDYENDWAFVTPMVGRASENWGVYVAGKNRFSSSNGEQGTGDLDLQGDIKFAELIGATMANVLQIRDLERRQSSLRPFFSPIVMAAMADQDPEQVLAPRECEVSVLFCDLRGFSKTSEAMAGDLLGLLDRVSQALGITTHHILRTGGVVGDFHGDAAMGFWGWPLDQDRAAERACEAALEIQQEITAISQQPDHPLRDFTMGVGIASGSAVAGRIGTSDQVKVTVFGPVVNLASRLEGLTRMVGCGVLMDEATAKKIQSPQLGHRRVAKILPYGLQSALTVHELLGPSTPFTREYLDRFDKALQHFIDGNWNQADRLLKDEEKLTDRARDFLREFISSVGMPPVDWNGTIVAKSK